MSWFVSIKKCFNFLTDLSGQTVKSEQDTNQNTETYGTFFLNDTEFGLPAVHFRKIVNVTDGSRDFIKYENQIVTLIDLKSHLNFIEKEITKQQKVAVIECEGNFLGLLIDKEGEKSYRGKSFANEGHQDEYVPFIIGILVNKTENRTIQILNTMHLTKSVQTLEMNKTLLTFMLDKTYAIKSEELREIIPFPVSTNIDPEGILNLNGEMIILVNTQTIYISPKASISKPEYLFIFERNNAVFGLMIDSFEIFVSTSYKSRIILNDEIYRGQKYDEETIIIPGKHGQSKILHIINLDSIARRMAR